MKMNLHLLRTFAAVVTHGGFGRAAEAIHVSQPAVSKAVRELESQLDMSLMEHGGRQVRLTEAGVRLYEYAREIVALEQVALSDLSAMKALRSGTITVGASMTIATFLLPPILAEFSRQSPDIDIRVVSGNTDVVTKRLYGYELDVALVGQLVEDERIERAFWYDHELVIIAPATHPLSQEHEVTPALLSSSRWVVREEGSGTRDYTANLLESVGIRPCRLMEIESMEGVVQCVAAGLGLAIVPIEAAEDLIRVGKLKRLSLRTVRFKWPLYAMRLRARPISPAVSSFWRTLAIDPDV